MTLRYLAVLATAVLVSACATTDVSMQHAKDYVRGGKLHSQLDVEASPQAVAECAARRLHNYSGTGNPSLHSANTEIQGSGGHVILIGRAGIGNPYAVDLQSNADVTHAEIYTDMEWDLRHQTGETVTRIVRECGQDAPDTM